MKAAALIRGALLALAAVAFGAASTAAIAQTGKVRAAYIAMFSCAKCYEMDSRYGRLEASMGAALHFVPVSLNENDMATRAWYALESRVRSKASLRAALFSLTQKLMMFDPSEDELVEYLALQGSDLDSQAMHAALAADNVARRVQKGRRLAVGAGVAATPAIVFLKGNQVVRVVERQGSTDDAFVDTALSTFKELSQ